MSKKLLLVTLSLIFVSIGCGDNMSILFEEKDRTKTIPLVSNLVVDSPVFNFASGMYSHDLEIEITSPTEGAEIFYTIDDSLPDENSLKYKSELPLNGDGNSIKIRAKSYLDGVYSDESTVTYSVDYGQVSTPQFKVIGKPFNHELGGFYDHDIMIEVTCSTPGADIYYTIDGTVPDTNSDQFSFPIFVNGLTGTVTISTFAVKTDFDDSNIETATFTVEYLTTDPPIFDPPGGEYTEAQIVNLYSETEGATIVFTTDGTDPMSSSTIQTGDSVLIDRTMLLRAYAMKPGMWSSVETQANYVIIE